MRENQFNIIGDPVSMIESNNFYQSFFYKNPTPMWVYDTNTLNFLMVNEAAIQEYGYSHQEFLNMTIKDIRPPEDIPILLENIYEEKSTIQNSGTFRHKKKNGSIILVKISANNTSMNGLDARVVMVFDVSEKVTAKQNLVTEVAKLKSIIESTTDIIFSLDRDYCYTSFNNAHSTVMKISAKTDIELGKNFLSYLPTVQEKLTAKRNIDRALNGERVEEVSVIDYVKTNEIYLNISHNPIWNENGEIIGVSIFAKDISESKKAADVLARREKEYQFLFNADLTGHFITTPEGKIILCNPKFLKIFGFTSLEEASKTSAFTLYKNPKERSVIVSKIIEYGKIENNEIEFLKRDGSVITTLQNIVGQFDKRGNLERLIGYILDITEQKLANEKIKQLSLAVEQSPVTIVITDTDGKIQYVNQKGLELTGYTMEELLNNNPRILSSGEKTRDEYQLLWEAILAGDEWKGEFHNKKKNGDLYWESATISPIKNERGEITNFLAVKEDITGRKQNELELMAAKEKAEEINKIKSIFFSNMSHELRTPLVGIIGFADILSDKLEDENGKIMAAAILNSGKRLLTTLTSLMNLSELETLKTNLEIAEVDANNICADLINSHSINPIKHDIILKTEFKNENLLIKINVRLFRESLTQLLNNSITYTEKGLIILKTYNEIIPGSDQMMGVIEIIDTGIGIPIEKQKIVFDEFRQASEGYGRNFEGTGLGLTLAKRYVELMGGNIQLESEVGKGTKVSLFFPTSVSNTTTLHQFVENSHQNVHHKFAAINSHRGKKNVLIVEDDEINRIFLEKCFFKDFHYKTVGSGPSAIQSTSKETFDLILMDINLTSEMNGLITTQEIRKMKGYESIPIVAMTAYTAPEEIDEFLTKGCSHYISKPFLMNELLSLVNKILIETN